MNTLVRWALYTPMLTERHTVLTFLKNSLSFSLTTYPLPRPFHCITTPPTNYVTSIANNCVFWDTVQVWTLAYREEAERREKEAGGKGWLGSSTVDWAIGSSVENQQRKARQQWIGEGAELLHGLMEKRSGGGDDVMAGQIWFWAHGGAGKEIYGGGEEVRTDWMWLRRKVWVDCGLICDYG
ncbi:hypothetical protein M0R45_013841 [Rubus argutus]|uniref:Uncharacterized protein n=1 Tax=Rubus argutus TaxID=59490 RepID=A0AAW1XKX9_RUBAR